jgi:hypothetical protein
VGKVVRVISSVVANNNTLRFGIGDCLLTVN